jgi:hypothetical protein
MSTEVAKVSARPPSAAAHRMRLYRMRRRGGLHSIRVLLHVTEIDKLVRKGFLDHARRDDISAIESAISDILSLALADPKLNRTDWS